MTNLTSEQYRDVLKHVEGTEKIPTVQNLLRKAVETFFLNFGGYPEFAGVAPGKIGIFGENIVDFGGLALAMASPMATIIVGRRSEGPRFSVVTSADVGKPHKVSFSFSKNRPLGPGCPFWLNHVKGVIDNFKDVIPPFEAAIESSVPIGSCLGSSSAIQMATYSFIEVLLGVKSDIIEKVKACQEAEKYYVLKEVGLLDLMVANTAWDRHLMLFDLENNDVRRLPFKSKNLAFLYIDSHFPNILENTYVKNKNYFDTACKILKVDTLRKLKEGDLDNLETKVNQILEDNKVIQEAEERVIKEAKSFVKGEESVLIPSEPNKSESQKIQKKSEVQIIDKPISKEQLEKDKKKIRTKSKNVKAEKQLNFLTQNVEGSKKFDIDSRRMSGPEELKSRSKSGEFDKTKKKLYVVESKTKGDVEEYEETEMGEIEEGKTEVKTEEYYEQMLDQVKFFLAEIKNVNEAADAWETKDFKNFGKKMNESHELLKQFNNFHLPILDFLVQTSLEVEGVLGSRMVGKSSGGGGVITLIKKKNIPEYCQYIIERYKENEKELKEKCMSILYDLLIENYKNNENQINTAPSGSKMFAVLPGKENEVKEKENCKTGKTFFAKCFPMRKSCQERERNLEEFINPCAKNSKDQKNRIFYDLELNLAGKEKLCEELKPKRCGTWSRRLKNISGKSRFLKEKSVQERSQTGIKKMSSDDEDSVLKKLIKSASVLPENGKTNSKGNLFNFKRSTKGSNGDQKSFELEENEKKRDESLQENSPNSGKNDAEILDPSILEQVGKIEKLADPTFYVVSPFPGTRMMFVTKTDILRSLYSNPVPHPKTLLRSALKVFEKDYGNKATSIGIAPGTLTLFGEFMEFQLGYIICMALTMVTVMVGGKNDSVNFSVKTTSDQIEYPNEMIYPIPCVRNLEIESRNWANFIMGTVNEFQGNVPGFNAVINSSLPIQMGLNSCAALQACTFTFLENLTGQCVSDPFEKADLCGKSEFDFQPHPSELVTRCSSIKFFPTFLCKEGHLMFINCKRYKISQYFFDHPSYVFLIASCKRITTNVTIESLDERLKKCVEALEILQKNSLLSTDAKHLKCLEEKAASPEIIKRVKYVISEHDRTIEAVKAIKNKDYERVGLLMSQSHASLRDDYEVSSPEIELLVKLAGEVKGVLGAKMLGKGLTSTVIILVNIFAADDCIRYIRKNYSPKFDRPQFYITKPSRGAFTMSPDKDVYNIP